VALLVLYGLSRRIWSPKRDGYIVRDQIQNALAGRTFRSGALPKGGDRPIELSGFMKVWAARCGIRSRAGP
jgi:hypothetical protein